MGYCSFLKRKGVLACSTEGMKLGQSLKDHYCVILLLWGTLRASQAHGDRKETAGCQGQGRGGDGELLFKGYEKVLEVGCMAM